MIKINGEVLIQFDKEGLSINEGIAINADWFSLPVALSAMMKKLKK